MEFEDSSEVMFKENPRSKINRIKIGLALVLVFCFLLLIVCVVLAVLYSQELNKSYIDATPGSQKVKKYEICEEEQCLLLGLEMVRNMNKSVDPCEDFHAYACGGWKSRHPLKYTMRQTTMDVMRDKNAHFIKTALKWADLIYSKNDAVMKMVRVYDSCMNTTAIDVLGLQPLKDLIEEYGGWSISQNYNPDVTVAQRIGRAARGLNIDSLFGLDVQPNPFDSDMNVLMLKESALGLNKRDYLDLDDNSEKKRKEYKNYMKAVSQMFNASYAKMEAIYDFEVKLAKGPVLKEVLDVLFDRQFTGNEPIFPMPKNIVFFKEISLLYSKTNHALIADYIMWQIVRQYVGALPDQYRPATGDFLINTVIPRWQQCIRVMFKPFDMPLGLLYVSVNFNEYARFKIIEMIENARTSFIQKLPTQTWMDKETQEKAKEKALAIAIGEIGYPAYIKDPAKLKAQYDSLKVTDSLMDNMKAANHFLRMRTLKKFERPVDKKESVQKA
ncbi:EEF1AKMT4-ECE2 readthrough transcript protein-like [Actinia tenebrosa]|uniref:EEF1AKMT4-ECE2 readthrough transcript protein-like n=1 Tax=Actinia tenebrosa TaxID=6105 RepID=A0A6P8ISB7_ACTTE|nr:EEF1AKMT4-ECE2 readthrough transcript protein-like [Actinia tenebrosa]